MAEDNTKDLTSKQVNMNNNPTGIGGFGDNPQNRSSGEWKAEDSISYQYHYLLPMLVDEFKEWLTNNPEGNRTMAQEIAYNAVLKSRTDLKYLVEITNRTEGKAPQKLEHSGSIDGKREIIISEEVKDAIKRAFRENIRKKPESDSGTAVHGGPADVGDDTMQDSEG